VQIRSVVIIKAFVRPKRERKGAESRPLRVVAPTSVKRGSSSRTERALGPWSIMMSMT